MVAVAVVAVVAVLAVVLAVEAVTVVGDVVPNAIARASSCVKPPSLTLSMSLMRSSLESVDSAGAPGAAAGAGPWLPFFWNMSPNLPFTLLMNPPPLLLLLSCPCCCPWPALLLLLSADPFPIVGMFAIMSLS